MHRRSFIGSIAIAKIPMVSLGEVLVMDWGLAKVLGEDSIMDEGLMSTGIARPAIAESAESIAGAVTGVAVDDFSVE